MKPDELRRCQTVERIMGDGDVLAFNARLRDPQTLARAIGHREEAADDEADDNGKEEES